MTDLALQVAAFALSSFYAYPWKPIANLLVGDTYEAGYTHFRRDHHTPLNLLAHCLCLVLQVAGNFGFLLALDRLLFAGTPVLSLLTAVLWVGSQLSATGAPLGARLLACACIVSAYVAAPALRAALVERAVMFAFLTLFALAPLVPIRGKGGAVVPARRSVPRLLALFGGLVALFDVALPLFFARAFGSPSPALRAHVGPVLGATVALLMAVSCVREPTRPAALAGLVGTRVAAALTGAELFHFFSLGFVATVCQGESHTLSGELATLLQLEKVRGPDTLGYQYAHITFFPTLLLHSCWASITRIK